MTRSRCRSAVTLGWLVPPILAVLLAAAPGHAVASDLPWKQGRKFERLVEQKDLRDLLREFTGGYGISVVIDPQVTGTVTGKFSLTPQSMLDYLASTYGLVWFYDGNVLNISPADSVVSDVIALPAQNPQKSLRTLEQLGLLDPRFPVALDRSARVARVAGPKAYVDLIRSTLRSIDPDAAAADDAAVRVYRLRYAYAADIKVDASSDTLIPGLASVLTQLFPAQRPTPRSTSVGAGGAALAGRQKLVPVKGTNLSIPEMPDATAVLESAASRGSGAAEGGNSLPQFRADQRLNAIIVRDVPTRLAQYDEVIKSLDTKPMVVEIEARIIEISTDEFETLGIDWRFESGHIDVQAGQALPNLTYGGALTGQGAPFNGTGIAGMATGLGLLGVPIAGGAVATTVLGDAGRNLILRVNALSQLGKANISSTPRVLTLDNIEAVIEEAQQFYVRVQSEHDAGLFQVSSGTSVRVRPLVVVENDGRQLKLAIRIEDGAPTQQVVDAIPIVRRTSIATWAFIREGQSLLIGGFTQQQSSEVRSGVPFLSSLPVIGNLFKTTEKKQQLVERLFLLTPRIVEM